MKKNYFLAGILIIAILVTAIRFVDLSYSLSLDTTEDDGSQLVLNDANGSRSPVEFDFMPSMALLLGEIFLLCISLYRLIATDFIADSYLANNIIFIRPPPAELRFTA